VSPVHKLKHGRAGPCQITQFDDTGEHPASAVLDLVGSIGLNISVWITSVYNIIYLKPRYFTNKNKEAMNNILMAYLYYMRNNKG
jgi:hypothetical protein